MTGFVEEIAKLLESKDLGKPGESIFIHNMPAAPKIAIMLKEPTIGVEIDHELPGFYKGRYEAVIRHYDHEEGIVFARQVRDALKLSAITLGDLKVHYSRPLHEPAAFPVFGSDLIEYSVTFDACFVNLS